MQEFGIQNELTMTTKRSRNSINERHDNYPRAEGTTYARFRRVEEQCCERSVDVKTRLSVINREKMKDE